MTRIALAGTILAALAGVASANGRPAGTSTIHFEQGHEMNIVAGLTFGLVTTHDGGATWQWECEKAVGYGGLYDPVYAYSSSGAIFATTFAGLTVLRPPTAGDGCSFVSTFPGSTFVSTNTLGPDGAFYYAESDPSDSNIYRSTDDGVTFPQSSMPGMLNDWWDSLRVAPSNASVVYLSGYRMPTGDPRLALLFKSINAAMTFTALPLTGVTYSNNSVIDFVGIDPTNPDIAYIKVSVENGNVGDGVYRMNTATETTWTKIWDSVDPYGLAFLVRYDGSCVAATETLGASTSTTCKTATDMTSFTALTNPPHIHCLVENSAHEVWACTQNYGQAPDIQTDMFGIMKSTDLVTWTGVLHYQDIQQPVACPAGTPERDTCQGSGPNSTWCLLETQLGITSTAIDCSSGIDGAIDAGPGSGSTTKGGCCETGGGGSAGALSLSAVVGALVLWPRRRRRAR